MPLILPSFLSHNYRVRHCVSEYNLCQAGFPGAVFTLGQDADRQRSSTRDVEIVVGKSQRRMGPAGSDNWHAMLDGAEAVLREEGHAALTSRRIAERIGVQQRLVYYYFSTMDDLVIDLFHRLSERELKMSSSKQD